MTLTILLGIALLTSIGLVVFLLVRPRQETTALLLEQQMVHLKENVESSSKLIHQQMSDLRKAMEEGGRDSTKMIGERLDNAARVVRDVQKEMGNVQSQLAKMDEQYKNISDVGKDISRLHDILRAPKLRGSLGELFLSDLLAQVLPQEAYELQYGFKNGQKVDAIVRSAHGLIAIDSKFPLENFVRILQLKDEGERAAARKVFLQDVRKHIDSIAQKYILPDEGTLDLALMYVPAENVYYEIVLKNEATEKDLLKYAQERRVFPVSPNSFYAFLQTIAVGFRGMKFQEGFKAVLANIQQLKIDLGKFGGDFDLIGKHLSNALNSYNSADKRFQRLNDKVDRLEVEESQGLKLLSGGGTQE